MKGGAVASIALLIVSVGCFVAAGYCYLSMIDVYENLKNFGLEDQYYTHERIRDTVFNLRYGMVRFIVGGLAAGATGLLLFFRRARKS
jgi:hypothetical protein